MNAYTETTEDSMAGINDVRTFGVVGDGVTDDTAALQAALDVAGKTGTIVSLPAGKVCIRGT